MNIKQRFGGNTYAFHRVGFLTTNRSSDLTEVIVRFNDLVVESLMIPFGVVLLHKPNHRPAQ